MILLLRWLLLWEVMLLLVTRCKVLLLLEHCGTVVGLMERDGGIERLLLPLLRQHREGLGNRASGHSHWWPGGELASNKQREGRQTDRQTNRQTGDRVDKRQGPSVKENKVGTREGCGTRGEIGATRRSGRKS